MLKWLRTLFINHSWTYDKYRDTRTCNICKMRQLEHYSEDEFLGCGYLSWETVIAGLPENHF